VAQAVPVRVRLWAPFNYNQAYFLQHHHIDFYKEPLAVAFLLPDFHRYRTCFHFIFHIKMVFHTIVDMYFVYLYLF
jgi:hypothetical protein